MSVTTTPLVDGLAVEVENDVSALQAAGLCGALRTDVSDQHALRLTLSQRLCHRRSNRLHHDAQVTACHLAVIQDLIHHVASQVDRNGKPDSFVASRTVRQNRRVDSDQFAAIVYQRSTGVSRIDWRVGLNEVLVVFNSKIAAAFGAHNAHRDRLAYAERIADGQRIDADLYFRRISQRDRGETRSFEFQNGPVCFWIRADDLCL